MSQTNFRAVVVMGVAGCGKSTVAARLSERLGWDFAEADRFHSEANIAKMSSGTALTDEDRWPWLDAIAAWIDAARANDRPCIVACSALKRRYRERLGSPGSGTWGAGGHDDVRFVYLKGDYETVAARLAGRSGHYMPLSLLRSQYDALEEPGADEKALVLPIDRPADALVEEIAATVS